MSKCKHIDIICIVTIFAMLVVTVLFMFGETLGITVIHSEQDESSMFTENDLDDNWDTSGATEILLKGNTAEISGNGAYFSKNILHIAYAGKYVISGTLNGCINIDADGDDKIRILFNGVNITCATEAPLCISQADKVFLTLKENSENTLTYEKQDDSDIDGCIYSRDDLTVNGKGKLTVISKLCHGIVCNDMLVFTGGNINITAKNDAVHAHDAIRICNTDFTVSAGDDGLHAGNDDSSSVFYFESGSIDIKECYEGIEANEVTVAGGTVNIAPSDDGINADSLINIVGGSVTVINKNGRDADGLDSNGSINIKGGNLFISIVGSGTNNAIDYGSENGGKCTISGGTVVACGSAQMAESPDENSSQGFIMKSVSGNGNDTLTVLDENGKEIISKKIPCSFTSVLVSCPDMSTGDTVKMKIGDTETEITVDNTAENGEGFEAGNRDEFKPDERNGQDTRQPFENGNGSNNPPEPPGNQNANEMPPQKPDGDNAPPDFQNGNGGEPGGMPPNMPDDEDVPTDNQLSKPSENNKENFSPDKQPDGQNDNNLQEKRIQKEDMKENKAKPDTKENMSAIIMIFASVIILAIGILIAVKKKY